MDNQAKIILAAVTVFLTLLLWSARQSRPESVAEHGTLLFRYNVVMRWFSLLAAFGMPVAISAQAIFAPRKGEGVLELLASYAIFAALGLPLWWETSRFALLLTPEGVDRHSPWRRRLFVQWDEVEEVRYSLFNRWFIIKAKDNRKIRVSVYVSGISDFLEQLEQHLPLLVLVKAKMGYAFVGRPFPGPP